MGDWRATARHLPTASHATFLLHPLPPSYCTPGTPVQFRSLVEESILKQHVTGRPIDFGDSITACYMGGGAPDPAVTRRFAPMCRHLVYM